MFQVVFKLQVKIFHDQFSFYSRLFIGLYLSGGEYELTRTLRQNHPALCDDNELIAVQCKSLQTNATQANFGQNIAACDKKGLICLNREQAGEQCDDYAIRYYCASDVKNIYTPGPICSNGWTQTHRLFSNKIATSTIVDEMQSNNLPVCGAEYVVGIRCKNLLGVDINQIDQSGFNPKLECTVDFGYK